MDAPGGRIEPIAGSVKGRRFEACGSIDSGKGKVQSHGHGKVFGDRIVKTLIAKQ